ncbi:MAG: pepsin/retropepsin-like aspartic protease family protein [Pseudomonadota bacterium]
MKNFQNAVYVMIATSFAAATFVALPAHAGATPWIDIEVSNGMLVIPSEVGGVKGRSIIDTGASGSAINGRFVKARDLEFKDGRDIRIQGVAEVQERTTYRSVDAMLFETPLTFKNIVDLNLGAPDLQLLIGADFLSGYVIQFDYPNERMRLISRDSIELKKLKNIKSKRSRESGSTLVQLKLNGKIKSWLTLDTGANGGLVISRQLAHRLDWVDQFDTELGRVGGVNSTAVMEHFRVPAVQIGPFEIANAAVSIPAENEDMAMFDRSRASGSRLRERSASDGLLGYDILKHFIVTVDYGKGYVHLSPGVSAQTSE